MLCKINATVGGATDEKARAINFLRAIQAICTAPAGSTPSVASVTTPTASPSIGTSGSADVITSVISNTEAGGWTSSASTTITSTATSTSTTTSTTKTTLLRLLLRPVQLHYYHCYFHILYY